MKRVLLSLLVVAALWPVLAAAQAPSPWHRTVHDKRGDAPAVADITRLKVTLTSRRLVATIHTRDLRRSVPTGFWVDDANLFANTWVDRSGKVHTALRTETVPSLHCPGIHAKWHFKTAIIRVFAPRTCRGNSWGHRLEALSDLPGGGDYVHFFRLVRT